MNLHIRRKNIQGTVGTAVLTETAASDEPSQTARLSEQPLIEYLYEDELVNYVFTSTQGGPTIENQTTGNVRSYGTQVESVLTVITDQRVLCGLSTRDGDTVFDIVFKEVSETDVRSGEDEPNQLRIQTETGQLTLPVDEDVGLVKEAARVASNNPVQRAIQQGEAAVTRSQVAIDNKNDDVAVAAYREALEHFREANRQAGTTASDTLDSQLKAEEAIADTVERLQEVATRITIEDRLQTVNRAIEAAEQLDQTAALADLLEQYDEAGRAFDTIATAGDHDGVSQVDAAVDEAETRLCESVTEQCSQRFWDTTRDALRTVADFEPGAVVANHPEDTPIGSQHESTDPETPAEYLEAIGRTINYADNCLTVGKFNTADRGYEAAASIYHGLVAHVEEQHSETMATCLEPTLFDLFDWIRARPPTDAHSQLVTACTALEDEMQFVQRYLESATNPLERLDAAKEAVEDYSRKLDEADFEYPIDPNRTHTVDGTCDICKRPCDVLEEMVVDDETVHLCKPCEAITGESLLLSRADIDEYREHIADKRNRLEKKYLSDEIRKEVQSIAEALGHHPSKRELKEYSETNRSAYKETFFSYKQALEEIQTGQPESLSPAGPLDDVPDSTAEIPSHTDLLRELNWLQKRHGRGAVVEKVADLSTFDTRHYDVQFGSVDDALEHLTEHRENNQTAREYVPQPMLDEELQQIGEALQRGPYMLELLFMSQASLSKFSEKFGSLEAIHTAAGYEFTVDQPANEALLSDIADVAATQGHPPTSREYREHGKFDPHRILRRFDTWMDALAAAGCDLEPTQETIATLRSVETAQAQFEAQLRLSSGLGIKALLADDLHRLTNELGGVPTSDAVAELGRYPVSEYEAQFGSVQSAVEYAGLESTAQIHPTQLATFRDELREELTRVVRDRPSMRTDVGETDETVPPMRRRVRTQGEYPILSYVLAFGSWGAAVEAAGFDANDEPSVTEADLKQELRQVYDEPEEVPEFIQVSVDVGINTETISAMCGTRANLCQLIHSAPANNTSTTDGSTQRQGRTEAEDDTTEASQEGTAEEGGSQATESGAADDTDDDPDRLELMIELARVDSEITGTPAPTDMRVHGEYDPEKYNAVFDEWDNALQATGINRRRRLLEDIQSLDETFNGRPTKADMRDHGDHSVRLCRKYFDTWDAALAAAGVPEGPQVPTGENDREESDEIGASDTQSPTTSSPNEEPSTQALIDELKRLYESVDGFPLSTEMREKGEFTPHEYYEEFGSWEDALLAAGIDKEQHLIDEIRYVAGVVGETPKTTHMKKHGQYSSGTYSVYFGSWQTALQAAGVSESEDASSESASARQSGAETDQTQQQGSTQEGSSKSHTATADDSREAYIEELSRLDEQADVVVKASDVDSESPFSANELRNAFNSWEAALEAAGIDRKAAILDELRRVANELGERPSTIQMNDVGKVSSTLYYDYFDSWNDAVGAACEDSDIDLADSESSESAEEASTESQSETQTDIDRMIEDIFDE